MKDIEVVSALVGHIYDAALDPAKWPAALGKAAAFVNGTAAALYSKDATSKTGEVFYQCGSIDPHHVQLYFQKYIKFDPATTAQFFAEIDQPMATADVMDYDEFLQSRFYREWVLPQKLVDHVSVVLEKSATGAAFFGVFRHESHGVVDETMRSRMRMIAPHVRRAVMIGRAIELRAVEAENLAQTLDGLAAAMFLLELDGRIVHANASGIAMLNQADVVRSSDGRLIASNPSDERTLRESVLEASRDETIVSASSVTHAITSRNGARYVVHVLPLGSGARRTASKAVAALFVQKAALSKVAAPEVIAKTYRLTPTELRVLLALVEVGGVPEVSEALGIAETTVKFHLRSLFDKTGSRRQAELVKLLVGFTSPLSV